MTRLLSLENKRSIRDTFRENAVFRIINAAYKEQERQMSTLRFSPEEIWVNCFYGLDMILKNRETAEDFTSRMWDDTYCELRDEAAIAGRDFQEEELICATSCIIYTIVACLSVCDDWKLQMHTYSLIIQIGGHSCLDSIVLPFDSHLDENFIKYIKAYIGAGRFISDQLDNPRTCADPVNPMLTRQDISNVKKGIRKRLSFMKGVLADNTLIMSAGDHSKMMEAVEYLIENNVVKKQETKIRTSLPTAHLRYTFFLVFKNEGRCITRDLWVEFLGETFQQMQANKASLSKHFSDKPGDYQTYMKR